MSLYEFGKHKIRLGDVFVDRDFKERRAVQLWLADDKEMLEIPEDQRGPASRHVLNILTLVPRKADDLIKFCQSVYEAGVADGKQNMV